MTGRLLKSIVTKNGMKTHCHLGEQAAHMQMNVHRTLRCTLQVVSHVQKSGVGMKSARFLVMVAISAIASAQNSTTSKEADAVYSDAHALYLDIHQNPA